jgi:imidazoleglycerol-phosphate dehydratase
MKNINLKRKTYETEISLDLRPFSSKAYTLDTGVPFFDHMLTHIAKHGQMSMDLKADGDIEVDYHHTVEDVAIVLGQAFDQALDDMTGVNRYGSFTLPMEEVLCTVAVDIRKSPHFEFRVPAEFTGLMGNFDCELVKEFFRALAINSRMNIHILVHYGENKHHISEAIFKCFAKAFAIAASSDGSQNLYSTKGSF